MKNIIYLLLALTATTAMAQPPKQSKIQTDRQFWAITAARIATPILEPLAKGELKKTWQMEFSPTWDGRNKDVAWLEGFGRLMAGMAPWLALPDDGTSEGATRRQLKEWALQGYARAVDPADPDYMGWGAASQSLVDASYLALSFIRAREALWEPLSEVTKRRYVEEFAKLRRISPPYNNWLLFRAMIEAFFVEIGEPYDGFALTVALRKVDEWYVGDGWYSDGPSFSFDYYNAYVIHPYMVEIVGVMARHSVYSPVKLDEAVRRMQRYDRQIERLISPEGTYPAVGRSLTYRMAAFHTLALSAWQKNLHPDLSNGAVRTALTAVMRRFFFTSGEVSDGGKGATNGGIFDEKGYLRLGFAGSQPDLADYYSNAGSLYITSLVFLPLGLPESAPFWSNAPQPWTSKRAWNGQPIKRDYHER